VDDFRGGRGGERAQQADATGPVRMPLDVPDDVNEPDSPLDAPLADAKKPVAPAEPDQSSPGIQVDRRVRRGQGEGTVASSSSSPDVFKNLSVRPTPSSGAKRDEVAQTPVGRPATPATPTVGDGDSRPTLGLPPKAPAPVDSDQDQPATPADEQPASPAPADGDDEVVKPSKPVEPTGSDNPDHPPLPPTSYDHNDGHNADDSPVADNPAAPVPAPSPVPSPAPAGDDGTLSPAPAPAPLPGGNTYDLLDHDAPSPTPITDEIPLSEDQIGGLFAPPQPVDGELIVPVSDPQIRGLGTLPPPQPAMQLLPEPTGGLVAVIAAVFGLSRRRRR
jgi:hypothetical protein